VADRSNVGLSRALREGVARAASAPAVLVGTYAVARIVDVPAANLSLLDRGAQAVLVWLVFWSLAYGGILDRFARNRPTRAHGFFAACGGHAMALARLAILALAIEATVRPFAALWTAALPERAAVALLVALGSAVLAFARVRLVVEDRRSACGALLASLRFLRRNPSGIVLLLGFAATAYAVTLLDGAMLSSGGPRADWQLRASNEILLAILLLLKLTAYASAIALFQARLAHAGYTAAPPAVWPESASAEAIANAAARAS